MNILGISCFYHDSAAALVVDGNIAGAVQEERFSRKKFDSSFPTRSIEYVLSNSGLSIEDIDYAVFYDKPGLKFNRIIESYLCYAPHGLDSFLEAIPLWTKQKLWISSLIKKELNYKGPLLFPKHHESHAASAFFPSPFKRAAFLTVDGVGEWETTTYGVGRDNRLEFHKRICFPHSLGLLYSAFTYFTGFKVNSGEYKVMGLAPYGEPKYVKKILDELIDVKPDGSFRLNLDYFDFPVGLKMINGKFDNLFKRTRRLRETELTQDDMDLARSIQEVVELVLLRMAKSIKSETKEKYLCLSGGVALNCVANGRILGSDLFEGMWMQPAAGDAGSAVGAALFAWHEILDNKREADNKHDKMYGSYLGPSFDIEDIRDFLDNFNIPYEYHEDIEDVVSDLLVQGKIIGWFNGRMEFGPRALGARSILGDARLPEMQKKMNLRIKYRESFRPFAPSVLEKDIDKWFEIDVPSPYMMLVTQVKKEKQRPHKDSQKNLFGLDRLNVVRSDIPAVTHIDYSARIQSVSEETNKKYYRLIDQFKEKTGCPVIINTSFNVRGEPIVCTPEDAYRCFMRTEIDYLVLENCLLDKKKQRIWQDPSDWRREFEND